MSPATLYIYADYAASQHAVGCGEMRVITVFGTQWTSTQVRQGEDG